MKCNFVYSKEYIVEVRHLTSLRLFKHYVRIPFIILALLEAMICVSSIYGAAELRYMYGPVYSETNFSDNLLIRAILFSVVLVTTMAAMGLYQAQMREGLIGYLLRLIASFLLSLVGLSLVFYAFPGTFLGRGILILAFIISFLAMSALRKLTLTIDPEIFKKRIVVLGAGEKANTITQLRRKADQVGFNIIGFIHIRGETDIINRDRILNINSSLHEFAAGQDIDEIVLAIDDRRKGFPMHELLECKMSGIDIVDVQTFFERETGKIRVDLLQPSWLVFSDGFRQSAFRDYVKRAFDIITSLLLLLITWPFMVLTTVAIMLESGIKAPILFRQVRVGEGGKPFQVFKFRSMKVDAEKNGRAVWATENDTRVTKVGRIIRKVRIDELPQIFNVIRGNMSFVGPRPERPEFVVELSDRIPYYHERHHKKPGITGWAQLCYPYGSSERDALEKLQYDLYYVKNYSLFLDFLILLRTAEVVLFGKGAR